MIKRLLQTALGMCVVFAIQAHADKEYFLGVGIGGDLSDVGFSQSTKFAPDPSGSWIGTIVSQDHDSRPAILKISASMREYFKRDRIFLSSSIDFQRSFDDIASGVIPQGMDPSQWLIWDLGALKQVGVEAKVGYTPLNWRGPDSRKSLYVSMSGHKAFANYRLSGSNLRGSDSADGYISTFGVGVEVADKKRVLAFELERTDGFVEATLDTSRLPVIDERWNTFNVDAWRFGIRYLHRFGK